jgi:hypothetical protein
LLGGRFNLFTQEPQNFLNNNTEIQAGDAFTPKGEAIAWKIKDSTSELSQKLHPLEFQFQFDLTPG